MPTNFVLGQILMLCASKELESDSGKFWTLPFILALVFSALVFIPITAWSYYAYRGWATVYLRPENQIPFIAGPFIFFTYFLGMYFGALLAQLLIQSDRKFVVYFTLALGLGWLGGVGLLTMEEYLRLGTYQEFHAGSAVSIFSDPLFQRNLNLMGAGIGIPFLALAGFLRWRSRRFE